MSTKHTPAPRPYSDDQNERLAFATGWAEGRASAKAELEEAIASRDSFKREADRLHNRLHDMLAAIAKATGEQQQ